jgi:RecG-like helicase
VLEFTENMSHCMCVLLHSLSSDDKDVVASASADVARARLDALTRSSDGFEIAERDLLIRGPGDSLGLRQAGAIRFK